MEIRRLDNGILQIKRNNDNEFKTLYHSFNVKNKEYILYTYDDKQEKEIIYDKDKIKQILEYIKGINIWKIT